MTLPKKGLKRVHVNGVEYPYKVSRNYDPKYDGGAVTIQLPNGNYLSKHFYGTVTPSMVKTYLEKTLKVAKGA